MGLINGPIYAGRANRIVDVFFAMPPGIDGTSVVELRLRVTPPGGETATWPTTIDVETQTARQVNARHVTDGVLAPVAGTYVAGVFAYGAGGALLAECADEPFPVLSSAVTP